VQLFFLLLAVSSDPILNHELEESRNRFCFFCAVRFRNAGDLDFHRYVFHPEFFQMGNTPVQVGGGSSANIALELIQSAGRGIVREYEADLTQHVFADTEGVFNSILASMTDIMRAALTEIGGLKTIVTTQVEMTRESRINPGTFESEDFPFHSFLHTCLEPSAIPKLIYMMKHKIGLSIQTFLTDSSGWRVKRFKSLQQRMYRFQMDKGAGWMKTPKSIVGKQCLVNIRNDDEFCFMYSILAGLFPIYRNANVRWEKKVDPRTYCDLPNEIDWNCINFPMTIDQLDKFHHFNPQIAVNVFGYEEIDELDPLWVKKKIRVFPLYICKEIRQTVLDLLILIDGDRAHFTLLKQSDSNPTEGLSKLLGKSERNTEKFVCRFCLNYSLSQSHLYNHREFCMALELQRTTLPKKTFYTFKEIRKTLPVPFVIYCDF